MFRILFEMFEIILSMLFYEVASCYVARKKKRKKKKVKKKKTKTKTTK